ncbi:MAG: hypothetical protein AB8H80_11575 [Planctomycetota bacterium]
MTDREANADEPARPRVSDAIAPLRWARRIRRATMVVGILGAVWFFVQFKTCWVPRGMATVPSLPAGSWLVLDRWSMGLRVGSHVMIETPHGELLSRVSKLDDDEVWIEHPNARSGYGDSAMFGALPRTAVDGVVVVSFGSASAPSAEDPAAGGAPK